ncbi:amidohydrolase [Flavobacteriaceae bacterium AH-315-B10]|nr:amidohydrolase [Flavobacteriaceae bacterium AH-315-B10]
MKTINFSTMFILLCFNINAQQSLDHVLKGLESQTSFYGDIAHTIWNYAEMGYQEEKSSALLQKTLKDEGFSIEIGVAGMPTAFIAEYGSGNPIIGILGEYDALPGLSQQAVAEKKSAGAKAGHACGHHLFGTASTAAAISVKNWLLENNILGTIRFYGCPAEEGGSGKVYMTRAGLFNDVDVVLNWHPSNQNSASPRIALANKSAKFRFYGVSAHAAGAPEKGRSALDAVEAMNYMVNMMREHIPQEARIHYVITDGGKAPNVVPDFAEVYYYARHPQRDDVINIFDRIIKASQGAAMGTDTTTDYEMIGGTHEMLQNLTLQKLMYDNLVKIGGYTYTAEEKAFAEKVSKSLNEESLDVSFIKGVVPFSTEMNSKGSGSTDVGDVSFAAPTVGLRTATWVPGTPAHSWQAVAAGGTSIGTKGMMVAAKTMTATAIELFSNTAIIDKAKAEFLESRGMDFKYIPLLGDRVPALNYRN